MRKLLSIESAIKPSQLVISWDPVLAYLDHEPRKSSIAAGPPPRLVKFVGLDHAWCLSNGDYPKPIRSEECAATVWRERRCY